MPWVWWPCPQLASLTAGMSLSPGCSDGSFLCFLGTGPLNLCLLPKASLEPFFTSIFMGLMTGCPPSSIIEEIRSKKTIVNKVQGELATKTTATYRKRQTQ